MAISGIQQAPGLYREDVFPARRAALPTGVPAFLGYTATGTVNEPVRLTLFSHLAEAFGHEQVWLADGFADRWDLPLDHGDTGYRHSRDQVDAVRVTSAQQLLDYFDAVHRLAGSLVADLDEQDLHRVVDERWDPPVTLLVRLVSVLDDAVQHAGQAAYARGIILADRQR